MFRRFIENTLTKVGVNLFKKAKNQKKTKQTVITKKPSSVLGSSMDIIESRKVLNFEKEDEITSKILSERYWNYMARNSEEKGGSAYLRAKIENAKDSLMSEYGLQLLKEKEVETKTKEKEEVIEDLKEEVKGDGKKE